MVAICDALVDLAVAWVVIVVRVRRGRLFAAAFAAALWVVGYYIGCLVMSPRCCCCRGGGGGSAAVTIATPAAAAAAAATVFV